MEPQPSADQSAAEQTRDENPAPPLTAGFALGLFVRGFAMGAADVVPGVSGGTIAFITGIYEHFINALRSVSPAVLGSLLRGRMRQATTELRAIHWSVLIPLISGIAIAIISLSKIITGLMIDQPAPTYGFFFGLILASAWVPLSRVKSHATAGYVALVISGVIAWLVVGLQPDGIELTVGRHDADPVAVVYPGKLRHPADLQAVESLAAATAPGVPAVLFDEKGVLAEAGVTPAAGTRVFTDKAEFVAWIEAGPRLVVLEESRAPLWWIFLCGVLAISAMVLPGLSGSFLLLFFGQYHAVFTALHQTIGHILTALGRPMDAISALSAHQAWVDIVFFGVFLVGVVIGMLAFSRVVAWLFARAHDVTMMALTGLMIGALRLPGEVVLQELAKGRTSYGLVLGIVVAGAVLVLVMNVIDNRRAARHG